ncbi:hypothetical protein K8I28_11415 [bacterium]|nr:hypothetical protein [bacterium]
MKMLRTPLILLLAALLTIPLLGYASQDSDDNGKDYEWKTWRTKRSPGGFNGHGGFIMQYQLVEFNDIKDLALDMGIEIPENGLFGAGGYGLGHVGGGWRIGGGGFGVMGSYSGIYTDNTNPLAPKDYNREMEISVGGGGFIVEYSPWMYGPVNFGVGGLLGGGAVNIRLIQDDGTSDWFDLVGQYTHPPLDPDQPNNNIVTDLVQPYIMFNPYFTTRVHILDWMALEGSIGYNLTSFDAGNWMFFTRELSGEGSKLSVNQPYFRFGVIFGG